MLPEAIYKTGESERLAISVAVGLNYKEDTSPDQKMELSLMFLTPQSSNDLEKNYAVTTTSGRNVSDCLSQIESRIGKEIGLSHCQVIILSDSLSKHGPLEYLDSFTRTNDLTTNALLIGSSNPKELLEAQISESAKIAISLTNILDYIDDHIFTKQNNLEKFYADYYDESGVSFIPFIDTISNGESKQGGQSSASGGGDQNEGSPNTESPNDQSASSGEGSSNNQSSQSSSSSSNSPTIGSQGPAEKEISFTNSIGIFQHGHLVSKLDADSSKIFDILYAKKARTTIQLNNIETQFAKTADLTIEIEQKRQTIGYNFINGYPVVNIDLTLYCKLAEVNSHTYTLDTVSVVNAQITDVIKEAMFNEIETKLSDAINYSKESGVDTFYVAKNFFRLCTKEWEEYKLNANADDNYMQNVIFILNLKMIEWT